MAKKDWGNTNKSRGKIRRWSKDYAARVDDDWNPNIGTWMTVSMRQLDASQIQEALQEGVLNDSALDQIDEVGIENAVIYEVETEIADMDADIGPDVYQYAYATRDDFEFHDLFRAKGKAKRSSEFDYFVFEIQTPGGQEK